MKMRYMGKKAAGIGSALLLIIACLPLSIEAKPSQPTASWLLDAGHGGSSTGAIGFGHVEKDDCLRLTLRVGELLEKTGQVVAYTRTQDVTMSLEERSNFQKAGSYDYFVSFHRNAANQAATGMEIYTQNGEGEGTPSYSLARQIHAALTEAGVLSAQGSDKAFRDRGLKQEDFHVLRETTCPSILLETGFIDTLQDNEIYDSQFEVIAQAITRGCLEQLVQKNEAKPSVPADKGNGFPWQLVVGICIFVAGTGGVLFYGYRKKWFGRLRRNGRQDFFRR